MANVPDFSYQNEVPLNQVFDALTNKGMKSQEMDLKAEENRRQRVKSFYDAAKAGADLASTAVQTAAARQKMTFDQQIHPYILANDKNTVVKGTLAIDEQNRKNEANKELPQMLSDAEMAKSSAPVTQSPITQYGADGQATGEVQPNFGNTQAGDAMRNKANVLRTAAAANPTKAGEAIIDNSFPKPSPGGKESAPRAVTKPDGTQVAGWYSYIDHQNHYFDDKGVDTVVGGAGPAFAPAAVQNSGGGYSMLPKVAGTTASTAVEGVDPTTGTKRTVGAYQQGEINRLDDRKKALESDKIFTGAQERQSQLASARSALDTNNWVGNATILSLLAKGLGKDSGNLASQEQLRYQTSPELLRRIQTNASRWATGDITQADKNDIREALRIADLKAQDIADRRVDLYTSQGVRAASSIRTGKADPDFVRSYLYGDKNAMDVGGQGSSGAGVPSVGGTYNGQKVLKVERIN